jgi:hypothetical protein
MVTNGGSNVEYPASDVAPALPAGRGGSRATLLVGGAIVALIAIAALVVVAVPRSPTVYEPGSPEAAFQSFYRAYENGDVEGAYRYLASSVTDQLTLIEYRQLDSEQGWQREEDRRVVLLGSDLAGDTTTLRLRIDQFSSGGGLGGNRYSSDRTIRLVQEDGAWLIDEPIVGIENVAYAY